MNLDDLKLRTKILIPLFLMALTVIAMVGLGAMKLSEISSGASEIIDHRDLAATDMTRAVRKMVEASKSVLGAMVYDGASPAGRDTTSSFAPAVSGALSLMEEAIRLIPDKAAEIGKFKDRFATFAEQAKAPLEIGKATPGLADGSKLSPADLDRMAQGAKLMADVDVGMTELADDVIHFNDALLHDNAAAAATLRATSSAALVTLASIGFTATVIAGAFAMWMSSAKVARPLARLSERMGSLARGDLAVDIEGLGRKDEVGEMAAAVSVFKTTALEKVRSDAEAAKVRATADAEREAAAAERARLSEELAEAMRRLGAGLKSLAAGDLRMRLDSGFSERFTQMRNDFNEAVEKLSETMHAVVTSTSAIQTGTHEISTASDNLSLRTEQQAASLEETAAALDEITSTVKKSAEGAKHAREVAETADQAAKNGAGVVKRAVEAMDAIAKSSGQIGQIIGVIDEIAFQTNLLALNAGVEAARAGEAGRGFAVVASEVRALAQRSAEAAKEIKGLISTSTAQVDIGVQLVAETGQSLDRIIAQVSEINIVVADIAAGAQEQATGLQQVNTAINQMDQTTQQNATMVEESTAASHSLSRETTQLSSLVEQFQTSASKTSPDLRSELRKAAPHVFQKPPARPPVATRAVAGAKFDSARGAPLAKAIGGDSWKDF